MEAVQPSVKTLLHKPICKAKTGQYVERFLNSFYTSILSFFLILVCSEFWVKNATNTDIIGVCDGMFFAAALWWR